MIPCYCSRTPFNLNQGMVTSTSQVQSSSYIVLNHLAPVKGCCQLQLVGTQCTLS